MRLYCSIGARRIQMPFEGGSAQGFIPALCTVSIATFSTLSLFLCIVSCLVAYDCVKGLISIVSLVETIPNCFSIAQECFIGIRAVGMVFFLKKTQSYGTPERCKVFRNQGTWS